MADTQKIKVFQFDIDHHPNNLGQLQGLLDGGWEVQQFGPIEGAGIPFINKGFGYVEVTLQTAPNALKRLAVNVLSSCALDDEPHTAFTQETLEKKFLSDGWTVACEGPASTHWVLLPTTVKIVVLAKKE